MPPHLKLRSNKEDNIMGIILVNTKVYFIELDLIPNGIYMSARFLSNLVTFVNPKSLHRDLLKWHSQNLASKPAWEI